MTNRPSPEREIDDLILQIKGLVRAREQLRAAGAGDRELDARSAEIVRLHTRLANRVRRAVRDGAGETG